ncbi:MAG: Tar ligand binding domain-containing protein [Spirochaetes bacterium]|nr:Tar ligand binding domain-containing protein [Spirochaetota bacterium]
MNWFSNLKVAKKILLSCLVFVLIIIGITFQTYKSITDSDHAFDSFFSDRFLPVIDLSQIAKNNLQVRINMLQEKIAVQLNDPEEFKARIEASGKLRAQNEEIWKTFMEKSLSAEEKKLTDEYRFRYDNFNAIAKEFVTALENNDIEKSGEISIRWQTEYSIARDTMTKLIELQKTTAMELKAAQDEQAKLTLTVTGVVLALSLLVSVIITIILSRSVSGPVNKGLNFAKSLASGDLTQRIDLDQRDELGELGKALNSAANNLENLIANVIASSQNLAQAVDQISSGNQNLSQRTSEQASALEEIASTIEESAATIRQNADNAVEANTRSSQTNSLALDGGEVTNDAIAAIKEINESSKKIGEIISVINEISFQTNLLALNAAVEAARAGEQGRGFAVVAGEVRNLAQRSSSAAKEIEMLIKDSLEKVTKGTDLAGKSGEALQTIIDSVKTVNQLISEISAASEEQKQGMDQINNAIIEMDNMTQQNASLVEETAAASEEMANQAQELLDMVKTFKLSDEVQADVNLNKSKKIHFSADHSLTKSIKSKGVRNAGNNGSAKYSSDNSNSGGNYADSKRNGNGKVTVYADAAVSDHALKDGNGRSSELKTIMKDQGFDEF